MVINGKLSIAVSIIIIIASEDGVISNNEIAKKLGVSNSYVEQFAIPMRRAGIIKAKRGPGGGYYFDSVLSKVNVAMISDAVLGEEERSGLDLVIYELLKGLTVLNVMRAK